MSGHNFSETHHEDKTSKVVAWIIAPVAFLVIIIVLGLNESSKTVKKIATTQAVIDSLSQEINWRQKVLVHHDSLQTIVNDSKNFRKLPFKTRQEVSMELDKTTPKIVATKHNIEVLEKLLGKEKQNLAKLEKNLSYKVFHKKS